MTVQILKRLFITLIVAAIGAGIGYASDDEPNGEPIILEPIKSTDGPHKPQAPSLIKLAAYTDGDAVVVTSNVDVMAHVFIYDATSGQTYYNSAVALAPQCRCRIGSTDTMLTLQITVGDTTYEGSFCLH